MMNVAPHIKPMTTMVPRAMEINAILMLNAPPDAALAIIHDVMIATIRIVCHFMVIMSKHVL